MNYTTFASVKSSPFGGIPRNWKQAKGIAQMDPPEYRSPFGGIPRNWKLLQALRTRRSECKVPPSGGFLEIGNSPVDVQLCLQSYEKVPPSGGFLEIGNR